MFNGEGSTRGLPPAAARLPLVHCRRPACIIAVTHAAPPLPGLTGDTHDAIWTLNVEKTGGIQRWGGELTGTITIANPTPYPLSVSSPHFWRGGLLRGGRLRGGLPQMLTQRASAE
jgi:hypothetical protein